MMICLYSSLKLLTARISLISLVLIAFVGSLQASPQLVRVFSSRHFRVYHVPGDDVRAEYVADRAEEWYQKLSVNLGNPPGAWVPVPIEVYPTHQAFVGSTGEEFGERLIGRAYSSSHRIELDASEMYAPMSTIIGHELTHIFIFRILGKQVSALPLWANEGIAKYQAGEWDELDNQTLAQAAASGRLPALSELENRFPEGDAALGYAVSSAFIRYMSSHTNNHLAKLLLQRMRQSGSFEDAVLSVTGKSVEEWEHDWRREVNRRYAPYGWLRTLGLVAGLALPVLAVAAYLAMRAKKQRYVQQYGEEDGYSPEIDREYWPEH